MVRRASVIAALLLVGWLPRSSQAQTVQYHLHKEAVPDRAGLIQLKTAGPDAAVFALLSPDWKNNPATIAILGQFATVAGVPGTAGTIPSGTVVSASVYMKKSTSFGTVFPYVDFKKWDGNVTTTDLCNVMGGTAITTTLVKYTVTCTMPAAVTFVSTDRFSVDVGMKLTTLPGNHSLVMEGDIEGTLNGTADSTVTVPLPPPPTISGVTPGRGPHNTVVQISGANFGSTQGSSTVTFNGVAASPTAWGTAAITVPVSATTTTEQTISATVTTGAGSANRNFIITPVPHIASLNPGTGVLGQSVTISGSSFLAAQADGASTVTLGGSALTPTSWSDTSIGFTVPQSAQSGPVVVTVAGNASNSATFTLITTGTIAGTITRATGGTALSGATVQAVLAGVTKGTATTAGNGSYSIPNLNPGIYDVRVLATGFSSEVRSTTVSVNATTTVNVAMLQPGSLSGKVTQSDGVTPISGAAVTIYSGSIQKGSASTNGTGDYSVANLHPGAFTVRAADVGYRTKEQGATVTENTNTTSNLSLDPAGTGGVGYVYDELGRLVQVTDPSGDSAIYRYDAVGNIIAIERPGSTTVSISEFTPNSGPAGTTVTISGSGFSTTPGSNTVTFGGTATTVTAATATQLTVTAPAGGQVAVSTTNGSANSGSALFALTTAGSPTITGFSPGTVAAGVSLTVTGTNFDTVPANNNLTINVSPVQITSATATAIQASVPPSATTGRIGVATPNGAAMTSTYLWVAPPPYGVADLDSTTGTLTFGTGVVVSAAAGKQALRVFEGTAGHRASIKVTGVTTSTNVYFYDALGSVMQAATTILASGFVEVATLRSTATYSVIVGSPNGADSATLTLYDVPPDFTGTIAAGGSSVTVPITTPGQNGKLTFSGTVGQRVSLAGANGTITSQILGCDVYVSILNPDGTVLAAATCMEGSGFIDATTLPSTGTYTILVDPQSYATGNLPLTLYNITDYTGTITADGVSSVTVPITTPGQNATLTFSGALNQWVSLRGTNGTISGQIVGCDVNVSIIRSSDSSTVAAATCMEGSGFIDATKLPANDTYTIVVDPASTATGNLTLTLYTVTDFASTITAGSPLTVPISTPGQNGRLTFAGTAQQRISLEGTNGTIAGQILGCDVNVSIVRASDGLVVAGATCMEVSGFIDVITLPTTDTYTVVVDPVSTATGNLTLTLYSVPADVTGSLTINAAAAPVSLQTPGQNGSFTFSVASSQAATVRLTSNTIVGTSPCVTVSLLNGSTTITSGSSCAASFSLTQQTLAAGTYTVKIDPVGNSKGAVSVQVTSP